VESLGEKLKTAREAKNLTFDQVGKDTKISIRYLKALEEEDFSDFPGEAYITGFLRNYGVYLDLNIQELLSLYRSFRLQEQPIPVDQLLKKSSKLPKIVFRLLLGIIAVGVIAVAIYFFINSQNDKGATVDEAKPLAKYLMEGDTYDRLFYIGDSITISSGINSAELVLLNIGDVISIHTPDGEKQLDAINSIDIPLDEGLNVNISALPYEKDRQENGVHLHFKKENTVLTFVQDEGLAETMNAQGQSITAEIFLSSTPYPFTLQSAFQNYCMFRWEILQERDRRERKEQFFQRSEEFNIQAQNGIRIWASNAQAAKFQVIGAGRSVPVEIGGAGEVVVCEIKWVRGTDNRWRLVVARYES